MTRQCSTCRWWGNEDTIDHYGTRCLDGSEIPEMRRCMSPMIRFPYDVPPDFVSPDDDDDYYLYRDYPPEGGAIVVDGSGYCAAFETTATFGCLRWEEK